MQTRASFILIFLFIMLSPMRVSSQIVTGAEQMDQYMPLLKGKRIGMVVNHTSVVGAKRVHLLDTLLRRDVRVVKDMFSTVIIGNSFVQFFHPFLVGGCFPCGLNLSLTVASPLYMGI